MKQQFILLLILVPTTVYSQSLFSKSELSINGFRCPSIGAEFRYHQVSIHAGYYLTAFSGVTTNFMKTGVTFWFLPVGKKENPSSFFAGASYMRGLDHDYEDKNALGAEAGFRWMIWKGLNLRIGVIAVVADGESLKINPAGGISYSFFFNKNQNHEKE
jgi:hypothetical protein